MSRISRFHPLSKFVRYPFYLGVGMNDNLWAWNKGADPFREIRRLIK